MALRLKTRRLETASRTQTNELITAVSRVSDDLGKAVRRQFDTDRDRMDRYDATCGTIVYNVKETIVSLGQDLVPFVSPVDRQSLVK